MMSKITCRVYLASSHRDHYQPRIVQLLDDLGHQIHYHQRYGHRNPSCDHPKTESPTFAEWHQEDMKALRWANVLMLIQPADPSAYIKLGYAYARSYRIVVYYPDRDIEKRSDIMTEMADAVLVGEEELINHFRH